MSEKYASDLPLPGGVEQYFDTLITMLKHVRDVPCDQHALVEWIKQEFPATSQATAINGYVGLVSRMGMWVIKDGHVKLTQDGLKLVDQAEASPQDAKQAVLQMKLRDVDGYDVLLAYLASEPRSFEQMDSHLKKALGADWKTKNQTMFRVSWLRSLGFAQKDGRDYQLTPEGKSIAAGVTVSAAPQVELPVAESATPAKISDDAHPEPASDRATQIADRIEKASRQGGDGSEMENATAEAFVFFGYETHVIGGSGNPDIVAIARMGDEGYRILIETKSRHSGVVNQNDVIFNALSQHKVKAEADYVVVVGPEFAGGNLEEWSKGNHVRLVRLEELRQLLLAHAQAVLPLDRLEGFWKGGGSTDEAVLTEILSESENAVMSIALAREVYKAVRKHQDGEGLLTAHSLYYILRQEHAIPAIEATITLLQSDLIGALGQSSKGSLYTRLGPSTLKDKLGQIGQIIGDGLAQE